MAKKNLPEHPVIKALPNVTLVMASLVAISNFVNKDFLTLNIWVVLVFLLLCWLYSLYLVRPQKSPRKGAPPKKRQTFLAYLPVFGIPVLMIVISTYRFSREEQCTDTGLALTIGVADFEDANEKQDFTTEVLSYLREKIHSEGEGVLLKHISSFFDLKEQDDAIFRKLEESARSNCINQGLIIYGRWKEKQNYPLYHGYFFIQDSEAYQKTVALHPRRILDSLHFDIKMPKEFKFEMPKYADSLANAALAIVKFYGGSYAEARKLLLQKDVAYSTSVFHLAQYQQAESANTVVANNGANGLKSIMEFYLATMDVMEGNIESARHRYQRSYRLDIRNDYANINYEYLTRMTATNHVPPDSGYVKPDDRARAVVSPAAKARPQKPKKHAAPVLVQPVPKNLTADTLPKTDTSATASGIVKRETVGKPIVALNSKVKKVDEYSSVTFESKTYEEVAIFAENGKFGIWDKNHNILTDQLYDKISAPGQEGFLRVTSNGKVGFITVKGRPVTKIKFDAAHDFQEGMAAVRLNGKWGFIDRKGVEIIPCQYEFIINDFMRETAVVSHGGKKAMRIDKHGGLVRHERLKVEP